MDKQIAELNANPVKVLQSLNADDIADILEHASELYYNTAKSVLNDDIYDMAKEYLEKKAPKHPFLAKVGAPITSGDKVDLPYWMGSLNKIRDDAKHVEKWKRDYPGNVVVSDKLDGISGMLVVEKGVCTLYSRGNGFQGQNISHLLPFIKGIPENVQQSKTPFAVRGELIISRANWEAIKNVGANARNVVAGQVNKKSPDGAIAGKIDFVAYELIQPKMVPSLGLAMLKDLGYKVVYNVSIAASRLEQDFTMVKLSEILIDRRKHSAYDIDGIVAYQDETHRVTKGKNPAYAFAYKSIHTHDSVEVIVTEVQWNVSKDGYFKPTVLFNSVDLAGVKINKATGFNGAYIEHHVIGPGSRIVIIRSGDVIPHIQNVLTPSASGAPMMPGTPYKWTDTHVDIISTDSGNSDMTKSSLEHFVKKLDIQGVGPGIIAKLVDAKIDTIPKLLNVTVAQLRPLPGFQAKSAEKVATSIKHARDTVTCVDLMVASNILGRGVGSRKIEAIIKAHPDILKRKTPKPSELTSVEGIGSATAKLFCDGLNKFFIMVDEIGIPCRSGESPPQPPQPQPSKSPPKHEPPKPTHNFANMTIVFSGFRNKDWEKIIESNGGKVTTSISKNTSLLVVSDINDSSSKIKKARDLGVKIIGLSDFKI